MTEKNYNPEQMTKKSTERPQAVPKVEHTEKHEHKNETQNKAEEKPTEKQEKKHVHDRQKKAEAFVNAKDVPISTKQSAAICNFIRGRKISLALIDLEKVAKIKMAVPMTGEIPHRKGQGMMSGRFPQKAAKEFIILLKSLNTNAIYNGIENPIITQAVANIGVRPFGRYGIRKKRTHVTLTAKAIGGKK